MDGGGIDGEDSNFLGFEVLHSGASFCDQSTVQNLLAVSDLIDTNGISNQFTDTNRPELHPSHDIRRVGTQDALYCGRCAKWSAGLLSFNKFTQICHGSTPKSSSFQLRLLECGVIPNAGAKIPSHCKKRFTHRRR